MRVRTPADRIVRFFHYTDIIAAAEHRVELNDQRGLMSSCLPRILEVTGSVPGLVPAVLRLFLDSLRFSTQY
jgi:hypothetical protein